MRKICVLGLLFLIGCQGVNGPFSPRKPERVDDPLLTIGEQQRRGRERYALPDETGLAPKTGIDRPGPTGR